MATIEEMLRPEGFAQLYEYLKEKNGAEVKAEEIQRDLHSKYNYTSGKITGIIRRAENQNIVTKTGRGIYKLNEYLMGGDTKSNGIIDEIDNEISLAKDRISSIIAKKINQLSSKEFEIIKQKIDTLDKISKKK